MSLNYKASLTEDELTDAKRRLGREPNSLELAILDAEWSEHCSYKSSKSLLKLLPSTSPRVLLGPGYDAGVIDIGDGYVLTLHIESHNHPSAVDPYGGAATGVGGILRDILCMGTRPIAVLDLLAFGRIDRSLHSRWLLRNVVRGIGDYGNCTGVPTVGGELHLDECYETSCLVDVACIGVGRKEDLVLATARHPGDSVILLGGGTGRDGIHGVTFASKVLTEESEGERSAVQIPDPFLKKLIIEATLEAVQTKHVSGLKDLGGGGLACGLSEVAEKGGTGVHVELTEVHTREDGMTPIEIMISESQERMLFIVESGFETEVSRIFDKYGLPYRKIGSVTSSGDLAVRYQGEQVAKMPVTVVVNAPPANRVASKPSPPDGPEAFLSPPLDLSDALVRLLASPNISSMKWIYEQFDYEVGLRTVIKPGQGDAAVLRLPGGKFLAVKMDSNPRHCYLDPYDGAAGCVSEACRNVVSVGGRPLALVDHLQFGDPSNQEVFWTFGESVRGLADYCRALSLPCVGGKVGFYNEDAMKRTPIKPSPVACVVGLIDDVDQIHTMAAREEGESVLMVGLTKDELGGSEYYHWIHDALGKHPPRVDLDTDKRTFEYILEASRIHASRAVHDCSKGGLGVALAELCIANEMGVEVDLHRVPSGGDLQPVELLFSESHSRFLLTCGPTDSTRLMALADKFAIPCRELGALHGSHFRVSKGDKPLIEVDWSELREPWENSLGRLMGENA